MSRFENVQVDRKVKRRELDIPDDAILFTSAEELITRKNIKLFWKH